MGADLPSANVIRDTVGMEMSAGWIVAAFFAVGLLIPVAIVVEELRSQKRHRDALTAAVQGRDVDGRWIHGTRDSRPWRLRIAERRHEGRQIEMIVPAQLAQSVEVHRRDAVDRAAAALGLLQHRPTDDRGFDDAFIVLAATDPASSPADAAGPVSADTRAALRRMVPDGLESFIWSTQDQAVVARWRSGRTAADDARQVGAVLDLAAATSTPGVPAEGELAARPAQADALGERIIVASLVVIAMFAGGTFAAIALDAAFTPVNRGPLLSAATAAAGLASLAWGRISWRLRGRQVRDYRAWLPMMVVAFPAFWVVAYAAAVGINGAADNAAPSLVEGLVEAKTRVPRSGTADYGLRTTAGSFPVTATLFNEARAGDTLRVRTHAGRLGVPWREPRGDIRLVGEGR